MSPRTFARLPATAWLFAATTLTSARGRAQDSSRVRVWLRSGDSAWDAKAYAAARQAYGAVVRSDTSASSRAVFRLATLLAWNNDLALAIRLHRAYIRMEPKDAEGRIALARTLAWSASYDAAVAIYDSVASHDGSQRDAVLGAAQALSWGGRQHEAIARYRRWLAEHPTDTDARLALARTLAWAGDLSAAEDAYHQAVQSGMAQGAHGDSLEAAKGLARVAAWRGSLDASETLWRNLSARYPSDPEVWAGLAQVLRWRGEPEAAEVALRRAIALRPDYADAIAQLTWVQAELRPALLPTFASTGDSDDSQTTLWSLAMSARFLRQARVGAVVMRRDAQVPGVRAHDTDGRATARWWPADNIAIGAEGGVAGLVTEGSGLPTRLFGALSAFASVRVSPTLSFRASAAEEPFTETAPLIRSAIVSSSEDVSIDARLPWQLALSVGGGAAALRGGSGFNSRRSGFGSLGLPLRRWLRVGATLRSFGYAHAASDGYFSPQQFTLGELTSGLSFGHDLGWFSTTDVGVGRQQTRFGSSVTARSAQHLAGTVGYRLDPSREISLAAWYANVASTAAVTAVRGGSDYFARGISIRTRLGL